MAANYQMLFELNAALGGGFSSAFTAGSQQIDKMKAKLVSMLELLGEKGTSLRMPYSSYLEDGIFELRCIQGNNITRVLYFFYIGEKIIVTNGFVKKTQKAPRKEVNLAKNRRSDWLSRNKGGTK